MSDPIDEDRPGIPSGETEPVEPRTEATFESIHHPGSRPASYLYGQALGTRVLMAMLPLMVGSATAALLESDPLVVVLWGTPVAVGAAAVWAGFYLSRTPALLEVRGDRVAVYSIWDVASNRRVPLDPLLGTERTAEGLRVSAGWTVHHLRRRHWPRFDRMRKALDLSR